MARAKLPLWSTLALKECLANRAFTVSFVVNLSLGLLGFLTIDAFKTSINGHLDRGSRVLLGADLIVSGQRSVLEPEAEPLAARLPQGAVVRRETELMSMAAVGDASRLVDLTAVDERFPFYGTPRLRRGGALAPDAARSITTSAEAWVAPELLTQLGANVGDTLKIGEATFTISDVMEHDPTAGSRGLALAPKVYVGRDFLAQTGLLGKGSRIFESMMVLLPNGLDPDLVARDMKEALARNDIRVRSHRQASEDLNRALLYLNDYLGLVALVALFLAGVGGAYLFRSHLARRSRDIAILLSLGMPLAGVRLVYVGQLVLLGALTTILTGLLTLGLLPLLPSALGPLLPEGMRPALSAGSLVTVFLLGTLGSLLFCLPLLLRLQDVKPQTLFQEDGQAQGLAGRLTARQLLAWLPAVLAYWVMAVAESRSLVVGSVFVGIFLTALALFAAVGVGMTRWLAKRRARSFVLEMATLSLARHRAATVTSFVALGLGSLLVNLVPQVRALVLTELEEPEGGTRPSLFLFDIQPEQRAALESELQAAGHALAFSSPLIRARLQSINGAAVRDDVDSDAATKTREDEEEQRTLNRGYNLSYRASLADSETLVEGRPFAGAYRGEGPAEMSLEVRFAGRLGVGLGDRLTFEVQGVPVEGEVVSLRRVRWTSFQPNFFVQFQPGVLDDAPQTIVAAIPAVTPEEQATIQARLVKLFPNVSIIDVTATVERLLGIVGQMSTAILLMAILSLVAGMGVLVAIARHQAQRRIPDVTLLKILGTDFLRLRAMTLVEFGVLGLAAAGLGAALSVGAAFVVSWFVFDRLWQLDWQTPLVIGLSLGALSMLLSLMAVSRSLKGRPAALLGAARFS